MQQLDNNLPHRGRFGQIPIYLGKHLRMFVFVNDWKVLPMAAIIAALVSKVAAINMFKTQEGTIYGALALSCICIWNGCFNSIQVVCRERDIVKREHRDGMHISSYIVAHMIYQAFLCAGQTAVTVLICHVARLAMPTEGFITPYFDLDFGITIFLLTYASDMMALMISCIVRTTTSAMTAMPFVLIFELLFSGSMFELGEQAQKVTNFSLAKWGINALCAHAKYNELPMVSIWNQLQKFKNVQIQGDMKTEAVLNYFRDNGNALAMTQWMGANNTNPDYALTVQNITSCWMSLLGFAMIFAVIAVLSLERIDKDKR